MNTTAIKQADGFSAPVSAGDPRAAEMLRMAMGAAGQEAPACQEKAPALGDADAAEGRAALAALGLSSREASLIIENRDNPDFWTQGKILSWRWAGPLLESMDILGHKALLSTYWEDLIDFWHCLVNLVLPPEDSSCADRVDADSIAQFYSRAAKLGLDPFRSEIAASIDYGSGLVSPVILMDGWRRLIYSRPDFAGIRYEESPEQEDVYLPASTGFQDENGRDEIRWSATQAKLPRRIICLIYIKGFEQPVEGAAYSKEDLVLAPWWAEHPMASLRNAAFKRAARCLVKGSAGVEAGAWQQEREEIKMTKARARAAAKAGSETGDGFQSFGVRSAEERGVPVFVDGNGRDVDVIRAASEAKPDGNGRREMA